jgi:hypothetical protein
MLRNLFYNCCPHVDAEEVWLDNNKLLINIKTGENMADPEFVKSRFVELEQCGDVEFCLVPNDPELHELAGFIEGLEKLKSTRKDEITFYAHTKGVGHAAAGSPVILQMAVRQWRNRMYDECLSDPEKVERVFEGKLENSRLDFSFFICSSKKPVAAAGCFLCPNKYGWFFAGTFYWVKHSSLFNRDWKNISSTRFGPEDYIPIQFKLRELHCFRKTKDVRNLTFYGEVSATYVCSTCGPFEAVIANRVCCPKCKKQTSFVEKINDMGF